MKTGKKQTARFEAVKIRGDGKTLNGDLLSSERSAAVVLFAHGSGSGRHSPRNRRVAAAINDAGMNALLFDLLTEREGSIDALSGEYRFDIPLLTRRLILATDWVLSNRSACAGKIGYFGASTGAAAALSAAARKTEVAAVVSRGGRPDMAGPDLERVEAATLLIVGENDPEVLALNREAYNRLNGPKELALIPGASHLFEEPGALENVARLASDWFLRFLVETA